MGGKRQRTHTIESIKQLFDGRFAQLGIRRVRHLSFGFELDPQRAFGRQRQLVFGGLAVDQELRASWLLVGYLCSLAVALFAHQEQQADMNTDVLQLLSRADLCGNDSLGIARTSTVDSVSLRRGKERRHNVHVRREHNSGCSSPGHVAHRLKRWRSTGMRSTLYPSCCNSSASASPTAVSLPVIDSMSISLRVRANRSMFQA